MNAAGFTSAFAPQLDAYLVFKEEMSFYGASRIWYLRQFDPYCAAHERTVFDRDTVEGWVSEQLTGRGGTGPGCPTSATWAGGCRPTGSVTPTSSRIGGRPLASPPTPTC